MNSNLNSNQYKYFTLMATLYVALVLLTMMVENHVVIMFGYPMLSGTLVLPLSYAISDIITEVYGYKQMRRLIWISFGMLYVSAAIVWIIMNLPTDPSNKQSMAYNAVFAELPRQVFTYSIAALVSIFLNAYILSRWKILMNGRFFWIRSLGSTAIGEMIFIVIWGFLGFTWEFTLPELFELMLMSYICKLIYNIAAVVPSSIVVNLLKISEKADVYDSTNFNPFSWEVQQP